MRGHYITAEDSGTGLEDMEVIRTVTKHVTGVDAKHGGSGDPSPFTALGVRRGIEACVKFALGKRRSPASTSRCRASATSATTSARSSTPRAPSSRSPTSIRSRPSARSASSARNIVPLDQIFEVECDVFAPCALGSALNDKTIPKLKAKIVAGAANNQLAEPRHGDDLHARGILYAPDYAINAGGLVNVAQEVVGYDEKAARENTLEIFDTIYEIAERSKRLNAPTYKIADIMVEEKLAARASLPPVAGPSK